MPARRRPRPRPLLIGCCIAVCRERAGLSKAELARRCQVSPSFVSQVEAGVKVPSYEFGGRVARALGMREPEELISAGLEPDRECAEREREEGGDGGTADA